MKRIRDLLESFSFFEKFTASEPLDISDLKKIKVGLSEFDRNLVTEERLLVKKLAIVRSMRTKRLRLTIKPGEAD